MTLTYKIGLFFIGIYIILLIITYLAIVINKMTLREITSNDEFSNGGWHGVTFFANPPLIIDDFSDNKDVIIIVRKHNKAVKTFWLNSINLIIALVLLNLNF